MVGQLRRHSSATEHARQLHDAARQVARPPRSQAPARHQPRDNRRLRRPYSGRGGRWHRRSTARLACSRACSTAASAGVASPGIRSSGRRRLSHTRAETIDARPPETVEAIRAQLDQQNAALVSVLGYEGLRPGEAYALRGATCSTTAADPGSGSGFMPRSPAASCRQRSQSARENRSSSPRRPGAHRAPPRPRPSGARTVSSSRTPPAVTCAARTGDAASGSPPSSALASPTSAATTSATPAHAPLYEGRTLNEVAEHLGHADPGFTARTYAHVMRDAARRRRVLIAEAIRTARAAAERRPRGRRGELPSQPPRQEDPANRESRRPDSNRGPLHYE
jgi:hypothetical protein